MEEDAQRKEQSRRLDESAARGAKRIYRRFVAVAVGLNIVIGAVIVLYDISESMVTTKWFLRIASERLVKVCKHLRRARPEAKLSAIVAEAARLTGAPMALIDRKGAIVYASDPAIIKAAPRIYQAEPERGMQVEIRDDLEELSGAWFVAPFVGQTDLLVIERRSPEAEGKVRYVTIGAAVMALGLGLSFLFMLLSANWIMHRPLSRLIGRLTGALARDVERRREAEEQALSARYEAERHLAFRNNLLAATDWAGIVATGAEGTIQVYNRAAEKILGFTFDEVVGQMTLEDLQQRTHRRPQERLELRALKAPSPGEAYWVDKRGGEHLLQINLSDIVDADGEKTGELMIFIDATKRKRLEAELQENELQLIQAAKMASLGEMATGVAHELNQPLNNIGLLASRAERRARRLGQQDATFICEKLMKVGEQVKRAGRIIEQLRTFGHPGSAIEAQPFDVKRPIEAVFELMVPQLEAKAITVVRRLPKQLPKVSGVEVQVEQVLINLLNNARDALETIEASQERRITVSAELRQRGARTTVDVEVADNGPGIGRDVASRLFQPFFTTKEVGKGTGLGLAISYGLIRSMGGVLSVGRTSGGGATFVISLPVVGDADEGKRGTPGGSAGPNVAEPEPDAEKKLGRPTSFH